MMSPKLWKKLKTICSTVYLIHIFGYVFSQNECNFYRVSTVKDNCGGCGVCKVDRLRAYCLWLVPSFQDKSCNPVNLCSTQTTCTTTCNPMVGSFKCICDKTHFGRLCDFGPEGVDSSAMAVVDDVIFPPVFPVNRFVTISVFISEPGRRLELEFISTLESLSFNSEKCEKTDLQSYCSRWHPDMVRDLCMKTLGYADRKQPSCIVTIQVRFPGLSFYSHDENDEIRDSANNVYALKERFRIEVFSLGDRKRPTFASDYMAINVLVGPDINQCAPNVYLRNIGETMKNILVITAVNEVAVTSTYTLSKSASCVNVDNIARHWTVWRMFLNHNEITEKPFKEIFMDDILYFAPFTLDTGFYKVMLNVSVWRGSKESYDYAYGYFSIEMTHLIPVISGGVEKKIYYNIDSLTLDGSRSKNRNEKSTERGLTYYWKCDQNSPKCEGKYSEGSSIIYPGPFEKNTYYKFTLTIAVSGDGQLPPQSVSQNIFMSESPVPFVDIVCIYNCEFEKSNPNENTIFEAVIKHSPAGIVLNTDFKWTYQKGTATDKLSVEDIKQPGTPNNVLVIPRKTFEEGELYTFQVEGGAEEPGFAEYKLATATTPTGLDCTVYVADRTNIYRGVTPVTIKCVKPLQTLSPIYTMYDKFSADDPDEEARVLSSGKANVAHNVLLTRGYVEIKLTSEYGLSVSLGTQHQLLDSENSVLELLKELQGLLQSSDAIQRANKIAVILDFIADGQIEEKYIPSALEWFLKIAANDEISSLPFLKVYTSVTSQILKECQKRNYMSMQSTNYLSVLLANLSNRLLFESKLVVHDFLTQGLTYSEIVLYSSKLFKLANAIYDQMDVEFREENIEKERFYALYSSYRERTDFLMQAMEKIMQSLVLSVSPYALPITVNEDKMSIWIKEDTPERLSELSEDKNLTDSIPSIVISKSLAKSISRLTKTLVVRMVNFQGDPYWWDHKVRISTNVIDFKMIFKQSREVLEFNKIPSPIQISLNNSFQDITTISDIVEQIDPKASADKLDKSVKVHQLRVPQAGRLNITFLNLADGQELRVLAMFNVRPDRELLLERGSTISPSSKAYLTTLKGTNTFDTYDLYFVGIIPGPNVPVGTVINYSFELSSSHCSSRKLNGWSTTGCRVKQSSEGSQLDCACNHLSIFGGFSQIPINKVNPFEDYKLLVDIPNNPYVFLFVISLLSVYFVLLIWTVRKDYEDRKKEGAIYLEDNFLYDSYPYLVAVYTGSKLFSGTSANVGIVIEGSKSTSRRHILRSSMSKTLRTGDDDWFLLFSPNHLGLPKLICLWSDYAGWGPEWYCTKVIVVDLLDQKEYKFIVESWLSLKKSLHIERYVEVHPQEDDQRLLVTIDNMIFGFRETHLWVSVVSRHPRSTVSRAQRLSAAFGGLFITMLVSCMFYGVLDEKLEDYPEYTVTSREVVVGLLSVAITALLINFLVSSFRRSFVLKISDEVEIDEEDDDEKDNEKNKNNPKKDRSNREEQRVEEEREKGTLYRFLEKVLRALSAKKRFVPVELNIAIRGQNQPHTYRFRRFWTCLSWFICIGTILTCSFLIILYGLKFGKVKSLQWLTSISLGFLHMVFIATPMKIITISTMSGLLASNLFKVVIYRIRLDTIVAYKDWYLDNNPDLEAKILTLRKQRAYVPLPYLEVIRKTSRERKKEAAYKLIEMILIAAVLVLIFAELETLWTTSHYWNNRQLKRLFSESYREEGLQLGAIRNISNYLRFLRSDVLPGIYRTSWYNGQPFVKESTTDFKFVFSGTSKLLGSPRLRQLRIKPGLCKKNVYKDLSDYCSFKLTKDTEDSDVYGEGWITSGTAEEFQASPVWSYTNESETVELTLYGHSNAAYSAGGYVSDLALSQSASDDISMYLERENWLDRRTKVVIFEYSLFCAFSGTFSWLVSITENLHIGVLTNVLRVLSISQDYGFVALDFVFLASSFLFTIRVLLKMNRNGMNALLSDYWIILEVVIVVLAIACIILLSQNILAIQEYLKAFLGGDLRDRYFQFTHLVSYLVEVRSIMIFLILLITCRFMKSWLFGKNFIPYFRTLMSCWGSLSWLFLVSFLTLLSYWRLFSYLLNSFMLAKNNFALICKIDFKLIVRNCHRVSCRINPYVLCTISNVLPMLIIMYFTYLYKVKRKSKVMKDPIDFRSVFCRRNKSTQLHGSAERSKNFFGLA